MPHSILAARSDFSIGESILNAEKIIDEAVKAGEKVAALTDTMSITGMIDLTNRAKKVGIKPIIGTRLRLSTDVTWRPDKTKGEKKKHMPKNFFVTAYVLDEIGMKIIYRLLSKGNSDSNFYYLSKIGFEEFIADLKATGPGHLAFHLGEEHGLIGADKDFEMTKQLIDVAGKENVFAAVVPVDNPYYGRVNKLALEAYNELGIEPLLVRPALYEKDAADAHEIMGSASSNTPLTSPFHNSRYDRSLYVMGVSEIANYLTTTAKHLVKRGGSNVGAFIKSALTNTDKLVDMVDYVWSKSEVSLPVMAPDEYQAVVNACKVGWKTRFSSQAFGHKPTKEELDTVYIERLKYELSVLKRLNFSGYFLLVQDIVQFAKGDDILVGPGRGSVGGSLVAYLMGITDCDPIRFGLIFERFINPDRIDLPDADLDFMSTRRHEIFDYIIRKYGQPRVAGVSNYGRMAAASAIRSISKSFGIPEKDFQVSRFVPKAHGANIPLPQCAEKVAEIDGFAKKYPLQWDIMTRLEGTIQNMSQHAAGVVVGGCDLEERAVIENRSGSNVVNWDKRIVEDQGLVKVDILGLQTLDIIALTLEYIKQRHGKSIKLMEIPLDDPKVLANFAAGNTMAIFQFESGGMRKLLRDLGADGNITFDDITAATALYRPGPMESGMMDSFAKRKQGLETVEYDHPLIEPILNETFGVIVYQEQVMKIAVVLAGYTGAEADKLRKIMGKKLPEEMKKERSKFVDGCVANVQCEPEWAGKLFDKIEGFAGYGFNKSHSVEYSLISWQAMWLKTNYPVEMYSAALTLMPEDKLPGLVRDAMRSNIKIDMPDINLSTDRFEIVTDSRIVIPFQRIKSISANTTGAILKAREGGRFSSMEDFTNRVEKRKCNSRHRANLDLIGAFARIEVGQLPADASERIKDQVELLPGLVTATVPISREMHTDKITKGEIEKIITDYTDRFGPSGDEVDGTPVRPTFGKRARLMILTDHPTSSEDAEGKMAFGQSSGYIIEALADAGLNRQDAYFTALLKRPKEGKMISSKEINDYSPYLDKEIQALQPPLIVLCGTQVVRKFLPDFKGKVYESAGKVIYHKQLDANLIIGFNPGEIYYDDSKQERLVEIFAKAVDLLGY